MLPRKTIRSSAAFFGKSLSPFLPSPRPRLRVRLRFAIRFYESAEPHAQCQTGAIFPAGTRIAGHLNPGARFAPKIPNENTGFHFQLARRKAARREVGGDAPPELRNFREQL